MTFIEMDRPAERGLHEDFIESHPWDREESSMVTSGRFQPMVREVADLEAQFGGRDLASKLSIGGLLHVSKEGLEHFEVVGIRNSGGFQG